MTDLGSHDIHDSSCKLSFLQRKCRELVQHRLFYICKLENFLVFILICSSGRPASQDHERNLRMGLHYWLCRVWVNANSLRISAKCKVSCLTWIHKELAFLTFNTMKAVKKIHNIMALQMGELGLKNHLLLQ